jgi:hypothetical protein
MDKIRNELRCVGRPFAMKIVRLPAGIWIAWVALLYSVWRFAPRLWLFMDDPLANVKTLSDVVVIWLIIIAAVIALARRRLIAVTFGSIVLAFMLVNAISNLDILGIFLSALGFAGLTVNRRWFVEKLPNVY